MEIPQKMTTEIEVINRNGVVTIMITITFGDKPDTVKVHRDINDDVYLRDPIGYQVKLLTAATRALETLEMEWQN